MGWKLEIKQSDVKYWSGALIHGNTIETNCPRYFPDDVQSRVRAHEDSVVAYLAHLYGPEPDVLAWWRPEEDSGKRTFLVIGNTLMTRVEFIRKDDPSITATRTPRTVKIQALPSASKLRDVFYLDVSGFVTLEDGTKIGLDEFADRQPALDYFSAMFESEANT